MRAWISSPGHIALIRDWVGGTTRGRSILGKADNWRGTLIYGFAHMGKSLFWYASELLFAYFLTELVGLSAGEMGLVIASGFLVSAGLDLTVGFGFAARLTTAASAGRLQLIGAVLCSFALASVFLGAWIAPEWRFGYAIAAGVAFRLTFAIYDIPQNALMALATGDATSRLRIASTRIWFSGVATLLVAAMIGPLVARRSDPSTILWLLGLVTIFAAMAITGAWLLARLLHGHGMVARASGPPPAAFASQWPMDFWLLLIVMIATSLFTPAFGKLEPYFATYTLASPWWGGVVILMMSSGIVAGQPVWMHLCARGASGLVMTANALLQLIALALFWRLGAAHPLLSALAAFLFGVGMVQWAVFSETVARLDPSRTGLAYGLFSAVAKLSLALGGLLIAMLLSGLDFRGADTTILVSLMAGIPSAGAICCALAGLGLAAMTRKARFVPA